MDVYILAVGVEGIHILRPDDTCVFGIYENLETAKEHCIDVTCYGGQELRYQTFLLNSQVDFDYYEAKPLFNKKPLTNN